MRAPALFVMGAVVVSSLYSMQEIQFKKDQRLFDQFRSHESNLWHGMQRHEGSDQTPLFLFNYDYFHEKKDGEKELSLFSYVGSTGQTFCKDALEAYQKKSYTIYESLVPLPFQIKEFCIVVKTSQPLTDQQYDQIFDYFLVRLNNDMRLFKTLPLKKIPSDSAADVLRHVKLYDVHLPRSASCPEMTNHGR